MKLRLRILLDRVEDVIAGMTLGPIVRYNSDKPHRCPTCHSVTDPHRKCMTAIVVCCACGQEFTRWPRFSPFLRYKGIVCPDHDAQYWVGQS